MDYFNYKFEILESIHTLDQVQTEKVLSYIKNLKSNTPNTKVRKSRSEAMQEIRQALNPNSSI